jgi:hypothetical protein
MQKLLQNPESPAAYPPAKCCCDLSQVLADEIDQVAVGGATY